MQGIENTRRPGGAGGGGSSAANQPFRRPSDLERDSLHNEPFIVYVHPSCEASQKFLRVANAMIVNRALWVQNIEDFADNELPPFLQGTPTFLRREGNDTLAFRGSAAFAEVQKVLDKGIGLQTAPISSKFSQLETFAPSFEEAPDVPEATIKRDGKIGDQDLERYMQLREQQIRANPRPLKNPNQSQLNDDPSEPPPVSATPSMKHGPRPEMETQSRITDTDFRRMMQTGTQRPEAAMQNKSQA